MTIRNTMQLVWRLLSLLASLRLTLVLLIALTAGVWMALYDEVRTTWTLVLPLALIALNLFAAILVSPVFRRHPGLLVFHLALLAILLLVTAGRLTYLQGHVAVASGQGFEGELNERDAGPWHTGDLKDVSFVNEGFTIDYAPGWNRGHTYNKVSWRGEDGKRRETIIGDNTPLELKGYRFYTTSNKGFAPIFLWQPDGGAPLMRGGIHLPSFPLNDFQQAKSWAPPGSDQELWVMLEIEEDVLPRDRQTSFRAPDAHHLILRLDDQRHQLRPGETLEHEGGTLLYEGLRTWMGYRVHYDWTIHWLFASATLGVAALGWHYWSAYNRRPWRPRYLGKDDLLEDNGTISPHDNRG